MPVPVDPVSLTAYAAFPPELDRDWLGRICHLSEPDLALVRRRADPVTRLGYATQLVTVRTIGTFLPDPAAVPEPVAAAIAGQLGIGDPGVLAAYRDMPVRWRHTAEIRDRYGYRDFTTQPGRFAFTVWLYRQAWAGEVAPSALFRAAHRQLLARQMLLPGQTVLTRLVASVRERATHRVYMRLAQAAGPDLRARLEKLLLVPEGQRRSELDLLRRPPFTPTITGLVRALNRLERVRGLGAGDLDLSGIPPAWIVALARYADQAWVTQLADLGPERRIATLTAYTHVLASSARDDVIDIFDVVFGDMQRAATHRGQKRRAGELRDYDAAVAAVHARMRCLLDALDDDPALAGVLEQFRTGRAGIEQNMDTVQALMRPPADPFHERLVAAYPQISRFLPRLIEALELEAIDSARPVLEAYHALGDWLACKPRTTSRPDTEVPLEVVTPSWQPHVHDRDAGTIDRAGYACCVLDQLRARLRRRDIYAPHSTRWGDPRAELLTRQTWTEQRDTFCEDLALEPEPAAVVSQLSAALDTAWRRTVAGYAANPDLRVEHRHDRDEIVLTPLDADPEPASLVTLRAHVEALLPEVEIADLPLEVHGWTGFLDEYTHMSGTGIREEGLTETLSALLVSESCNVGLTPVADETRPPLSRARLNWVAHNYLRSATHAAANTRLVDYHTPMPLAQGWGGGEMASADGMRFVIPVSTIYAAYNPRYFGRQRGSTLYSWMADTHTVFAQRLIPGTQRDSLHVLDGLIANQTGIQPEMVSTDTAGASEIVFALAWALGYRWAPRLADLPDQRLWRIDRHAHYDALNGLARNRINTRLIAENWDEICRLTASLRAGTVVPSAILRTLQRGPSPSTLARALAELGRVIKTLHVLEYVHDAAYRRTIHRLLSQGERRNALARDVFHGQRGQLRKHYQVGQENQLDSLGIMINIIVLWQTVYTQAALDHLAANGYPLDPADIARLSPLGHPTINLDGRYRTTSRPPTTELRPLRAD
ncbi:MAG: Tn3 family transposase [Streptosporangiaceae bacterium]